MKKLLLIVLSIMMVLSFAACGEDKDQKAVEDAASKVEDALKATDESGKLDTDAVNDALDDYNDALDNAGDSIDNSISVADYVAMGAEAAKQAENDTYSVKIVAKGNNVVYQLTLKVDLGANAKELFDNEVEQTEENHKTLLSSMKKECAAVEGLVYEYYDMNGDLIVSYEFK